MRFVVEACRKFDEEVRGSRCSGIAAIAGDADIAARVFAQRLEIGIAPPAVAAIEIVVRGDRVTFLDCGYPRAHLDNLRRDLVTDNGGKARGNAACLDMLDREPRAAREHACHRLARSGNRIRHVDEVEGPIRPSQQERSHRLYPMTSANMKFAAFKNNVRFTPSECRNAAASRSSFSTPNSFM